MFNRQKLIEELLEEHCGYGDSNCKRCAFDCLIRNVVEALSQPPADQWIPCSERLPEENGKYDVTVNDGIVGLYTMELLFYNGKFVPFTHFTDREILAWKPRPEPYKGGGVDGNCIRSC